MGLFWWGAMAVVVYVTVRTAMKIMLSDKSIDLDLLGRWAVVAGATDGVGAAFTHELARKGFNIVLISRDSVKLGKAARYLEENFNVRTKNVLADFTDMIDMKYVMIQEELSPLDIGVLVNNFNLQYPHPEFFLDLEKFHTSMYNDILNYNIWGLVNMTRFVLPYMVQKEKGLIINVSSILHDLPSPLEALYAASKAFMTKFSKDLDLEYREKGVHIHVLNAGLVDTNWVHTVKEISGVYIPGVPSPDSYAKSALVHTGRERVCTGYIYHTCVQTLAKVTNNWLLEKIMLKIMITRRTMFSNICEKCTYEKTSGQMTLPEI